MATYTGLQFFRGHSVECLTVFIIVLDRLLNIISVGITVVTIAGFDQILFQHRERERERDRERQGWPTEIL